MPPEKRGRLSKVPARKSRSTKGGAPKVSKPRGMKTTSRKARRSSVANAASASRASGGKTAATTSAPSKAKGSAKSGPRNTTVRARTSVDEAVAMLRDRATKKTLEGMGRYGLPSTHALGVAVGDLHEVAKAIGTDHALAAELWKTGIYEARLLCSFIDDPALVTPAQMDRWMRDFDNWGICDTVAFKLFDRTPHALAKVDAWARESGEFQKRASFALLASVALHRRDLDDREFERRLPLIEQAASDDRNFVKKSLSWALRAIAGRGGELRTSVIGLCDRLVDSKAPSARWIAKDVLRQLARSPGKRAVKS